MDRAPRRGTERTVGRRVLGAGLRERGYAAGRRSAAAAAQVLVEERIALVVEVAVDPLLVGAARVAEVAELERDIGARVGGAKRVVDAQRFGGREEVIGPAVLDQERRRRSAA